MRKEVAPRLWGCISGLDDTLMTWGSLIWWFYRKRKQGSGSDVFFVSSSSCPIGLRLTRLSTCFSLNCAVSTANEAAWAELSWYRSWAQRSAPLIVTLFSLFSKTTLCTFQNWHMNIFAQNQRPPWWCSQHRLYFLQIRKNPDKQWQFFLFPQHHPCTRQHWDFSPGSLAKFSAFVAHLRARRFSLDEW